MHRDMTTQGRFRIVEVCKKATGRQFWGIFTRKSNCTVHDSDHFCRHELVPFLIFSIRSISHFWYSASLTVGASTCSLNAVPGGTLSRRSRQMSSLLGLPGPYFVRCFFL